MQEMQIRSLEDYPVIRGEGAWMRSKPILILYTTGCYKYWTMGRLVYKDPDFEPWLRYEDLDGVYLPNAIGWTDLPPTE